VTPNRPTTPLQISIEGHTSCGFLSDLSGLGILSPGRADAAGHRSFAAGMESKPCIAPHWQFVPLPQSGIVRPDRGLYTRAVAKLAQCTVPKVHPGRDAVTRRTHCPFGRMRRVRDQAFQQFPPLGAVTVSVELDMAVDVVDEMTQAVVIVPGIVERLEKSAEHLRDYVFAAIEERR
jgi:hypothetical protein